VNNRIFKSVIFAIGSLVIVNAGYTLFFSGQEKSIPPSTDSSIATHIVTPEINNPVVAQLEIATPKPSADPVDKLNEIRHTIKSGENLSSIFSDLNLSKKTLHKIIHANKTGKQFATIIPGKQLVAKIRKNGELEQLIYAQNTIDTLIAKRVEDHFDVEKISKQINRKVNSTQGTIHSSLFIDGKRAGLSDKLIMELADIFAWDVDFALHLKEGDQFTVVYEKLFVDGDQFDTGDILSAEFVNQGKVFTAVRFKDSQDNINYYTPDGKSMRKTFLRTPVAFSRISSPFNLHRKHPILHRMRAHKGVDYAAKIGTPVKSTGDGKIIFRGRRGGYGRVVVIQHGPKYSTLYAHLSRYKKGQRKGSHVKQGQVIGYVGQSGLATGPHLHYEFRINGVHRNPVTVKLPHANPIKKSLLAEFKAQTKPLLAKLNKAIANNLLAKNQP